MPNFASEPETKGIGSPFGTAAMFMEGDVGDKKQPSMAEKSDLPLLGLLSCSLGASVRLGE